MADQDSFVNQSDENNDLVPAKWLNVAVSSSKHSANVLGLPVFFDFMDGSNGTYVRAFMCSPFISTSFNLFKNGSLSLQDFKDIVKPQVDGREVSIWDVIRNGELTKENQLKGCGVGRVRYKGAVRTGFTGVQLNWLSVANALRSIIEKKTYNDVDHDMLGIAYVPQGDRNNGFTPEVAGDQTMNFGGQA